MHRFLKKVEKLLFFTFALLYKSGRSDVCKFTKMGWATKKQFTKRVGYAIIIW